MQFIVVPQHSERRIAVEQMVSAVFLDEYGAMISRFPDIMVAVLYDSDHPVCAASLRNNAGGLFSEQYLDAPEIGRAHVCTPVTNAHLLCRLLLENKKTTINQKDHT